MQEHLPILKHVGKVLLIAGLIDIAVMAYCIANRISYSSTINIFAVIAGIFLMRGSPRAAGIITWLSIGIIISALMEPVVQLFQPLELLRLKLTLYSPQVLINAVRWAIPTILYLWVVKELLRDPILRARTEVKGKKLISPLVPAALSAVILSVLFASLAMSLNTETRNQIATWVEKEGLVGHGYKYYIRVFRVMYSSRGKFYDVEVTAYNDNQILVVPVQWKAN